jgi:hypothetical protein
MAVLFCSIAIKGNLILALCPIVLSDLFSSLMAPKNMTAFDFMSTPLEGENQAKQQGTPKRPLLSHLTR